MLQLGCDGGTNATSGVAPELTRQLYELARAGQIDAAREVQGRVTRLFDTLFGVADFPEGFRLGVRARGIAARPGRTPRSARDRERDEETLESLRGALTAAGLRAGSSAS
jgi:4-hydroxy-tetrahydrodipicolinate synthase